MPNNEISPAGDLVFKPCGRAFFVYYVAMALLFLGPRINPDMGLPVWLGTLLGLIVVAAVIYRKYGQEYQVTSRGVAKVKRWPSPQRQEIAWENLGEIKVLRGLTQTMLQVGNLALGDKSGRAVMFWFGLANPKDVKDQIDRKRP
jgi:predicted histidine transporter YuiF (NhaC family)